MARRLRQTQCPSHPQTAPPETAASARSGEPDHASGDDAQRNNRVVSVPAPDKPFFNAARAFRFEEAGGLP